MTYTQCTILIFMVHSSVSAILNPLQVRGKRETKHLTVGIAQQASEHIRDWSCLL